MAHFDVFHNPDATTASVIPYVVDVQSELLAGLPTRVVIPLAYAEAIETPILRLNPTVGVGDTALVALTQDMASVSNRLLRNPVANLSPQHDEILAALDFLFTGF